MSDVTLTSLSLSLYNPMNSLHKYKDGAHRAYAYGTLKAINGEGIKRPDLGPLLIGELGESRWFQRRTLLLLGVATFFIP